MITVPTTFHAIDEGFHVPTLDRWFSSPYRVRYSFLAGWRGQDCYKIYYQLTLPAERINAKSVELVVFRFDMDTRRLIDLKDDETEWVQYVVCRHVYVSYSLPKFKLTLCEQNSSEQVDCITTTFTEGRSD